MAVNYYRLNELVTRLCFIAASLAVGGGLGFYGSMFYYLACGV